MPSLTSWVPRFFRRPSKSVIERLEELEDEILNLESRRISNIDSEKRWAFRLILYSFITFGVWFILIYYYYWPTTNLGKALFWLSVILYPIMASLLIWASRAFYLRKVSKTDERLKILREEKQTLIQDVMETETFNKAQQILSRFDPLKFARFSLAEKTAKETPMSNFKTPSAVSTTRRRNNKGPDGDTAQLLAPTLLHKTQLTVATNGALSEQPNQTEVDTKTSQKPRLLRPVLARERTVLDRILDALVGDGPDKRYALVCFECAGHNGMALEEEFEYLAFRCCYCSTFNPPRRKRVMPSIPPNIAPGSKLRQAISTEQLPTLDFCTPSHRATPPHRPDGSRLSAPLTPVLPVPVHHINGVLSEQDADTLHSSDSDLISTTTK